MSKPIDHDRELIRKADLAIQVAHLEYEATIEDEAALLMERCIGELRELRDELQRTPEGLHELIRLDDEQRVRDQHVRRLAAALAGRTLLQQPNAVRSLDEAPPDVRAELQARLQAAAEGDSPEAAAADGDERGGLLDRSAGLRAQA